MNPLPEMTPILKQLRLSGILETLTQRQREATEAKMPYVEFLALVLQDEAQRREQKRYQLRLRRAGFRSDKTLEGFDFGFNPNIDQERIEQLAGCAFVDERSSVLIAGPCGTGKSHLAQALGHCAVRRGFDVLFFTVSQLVAQINAARATGTRDRKLRTLAKVPLLIIDDFGLKPFHPQQAEDFHDLIAERYENTATMVTSNLDFTEWGDAFPNKLLGAATIDRLRHGAYRVVLDGKSYREPRPLHGASPDDEK